MSDRCPFCGGRLEPKIVEHEVTHGTYSKIIQVEADVCQQCGERIYTTEAQKEIDKTETEMILAEKNI